MRRDFTDDELQAQILHYLENQGSWGEIYTNYTRMKKRLHHIVKNNGKKTYDIEYLFDRLVSVNNIDVESKSIMFEIIGRTNAQENNLVLRLPMGLIDGPFVVWIDGNKVDFENSVENDLNILKIPVSSSSKILTISGAHIVPEFDSSVMILVISTITVLYFSKRVFPNRLEI